MSLGPGNDGSEFSILTCGILIMPGTTQIHCEELPATLQSKTFLLASTTVEKYDFALRECHYAAKLAHACEAGDGLHLGVWLLATAPMSWACSSQYRAMAVSLTVKPRGTCVVQCTVSDPACWRPVRLVMAKGAVCIALTDIIVGWWFFALAPTPMQVCRSWTPPQHCKK